MLWGVLACAQTAQPAGPTGPARETTRYSLTSTAQFDSHDPTAWRLLASNDGTNWALLDVRTNQHFTARSKRLTFFIANRRPYKTYRLQVDAINSADVSLDMSVQLGGFDVEGPMVNVPDESKLQSIVSASCPHPVLGPAEFAFDDDPTTAWCDYGLGSPGGCWLQVHYAFDSQTLVTNLSQATLLTHVSAARAQLADGGACVISNLAARVAPLRRLTGYALTSANDEPGRDPRDWELRGSDDDGKNWAILDQRSNEVFNDRFERRAFALTNPAAFRLFRLQIKACMASNSPCQIARIEPLYADPQADAKYSLVIEANADNPPLESAEMAFDPEPRSKWLSLVYPDPAAPVWIQWQLAPRKEDFPVINQRQLTSLARRLVVKQMLAETNPIKITLDSYALTSANDFPARDPRDWKLLGSNDGGQSWDLLDRRAQEAFGKRFERRVFKLPHPVTYQTFRLQVDSVQSPTNANAVQLAELEPLAVDATTAASLTILASSQSENSPVETVDQLFDSDEKTKWLDYSISSSNHASWVEWRYAKGLGHHAIDMNRELVTRSLSPDVFQLQLPATVLFADPAHGLAGFGDQTGFQWLHLDPWSAEVVPGCQGILRGQLKIKSGSLWASQAHLEVVHPPADRGDAQAMQLYPAGSIKGRISGIFSGASYCGATLTLPNGSSFEARLPGWRFPIPPNLLCPVRIEGLIENLIAGNAGPVPSVIWAANPEAITLAPETEEDWNRLPDYNPQVLLPAPVHLEGVLEESGPKTMFIRAGTHRFAMETLAPLPVTAGSKVEAAGILSSEGGELVLRNPCLRAAPISTTASLLTHISEVQQFMSHNPTGTAAMKIKGVITYVDLNMGEFYLQEGDQGLDLLGQMNAGLCPKLSDEGNYVEVQGQVISGTPFATTFARVLGKGRLPPPAQPSWDYLISGAMDNRWVEIEGVITGPDNHRFTLSVAGGRLNAWVNELDARGASSLDGSLARVRGVCSPIVNARNQRLGVRLLVPCTECIELRSLAPENPFDLPLTPMGAVMSADSSVADPQQRYVRTRGVVSYKQDRSLFLQDQASGLRVSLRDDFDAAPGDLVEAVGRPQPDGFSAKLIQAVLRKIGHTSPPRAAPVDLAKVNIGDLAQQQDATRVELEGVLINESAAAAGRTLHLRHELGRQVFSAYLPPLDSKDFSAPIPEGSRLRIRGIFKAVQDKTPDVNQAATAFEIYIDSASDLAVLERPSWWTARHTLELMGLFAAISAIGLGWIWLLRKQVRQRTSDLAMKVEELGRSETSLATEVSERKRLQADADRAHEQLLVVARQAGMAEVATGILHNVGNVLNSVNVSSTVVMDRLRSSRIEGFEKGVSLLRHNEAELANFLSTEKGRNLLPYLEQLASHLATNHSATLKELEDLKKNIQHIKDIVAVQQDYARFSGLIEKLQVVDMVEDAIRMTASSREPHRIRLERVFDPRTPMVEADRHKVLQILVNLLNNSQQACDESARPDKRIVIDIRPEDQKVKICVSDNGVGIAPENMDRVFSHGFTTRKHGHGFGLHNAALAAKEMGGSMRMASRGVGQGASFTLELPVKG